MGRNPPWANLATLANGLVGVGAVLYVLAGNKLWAMLLVVCGIGFDGLDGWLSRRSGRPGGRFGRIADSVADSVTFGLAPAFLVAVHPFRDPVWQPWSAWTLLAGAAVASLAIGRLVWFTVRGHQFPYFVGVPTPQNAVALVILLLLLDEPSFLGTYPALVVIASIGLALTMVLPVRFPKIRRRSPLRLPLVVSAIALAIALVPLQFRLARGSPLFEVAFAATVLAAVGAGSYYLVGPFTVRAPSPTSG